MTYDILNGPELMNRLKEEIENGGAVDLAVAFWGQGALKTLGLENGQRARLICNLASGGTNPSEIRKLIAAGINVRMHNKLHAKIGSVGKVFSFLGSSNMSANGLGYEGGELTGWDEANIAFVGEEPSVHSRFQELWGQSLMVAEQDLIEAENKWRLRRTQNIMNAEDEGVKPKSLWSAIQKNDDRLSSMPCVVGYYYEMNDKDKNEFDLAEQEIKSEYGKGFETFRDWEDDLPHGFIIGVCRSRNHKNTLKDVSFSCRQAGASIHHRDGANYLVVEGLRCLPGFDVLKGQELNAFKALVLAFVGAKKKKKSRVISLTDLMNFQFSEAKV